MVDILFFSNVDIFGERVCFPESVSRSDYLDSLNSDFSNNLLVVLHEKSCRRVVGHQQFAGLVVKCNVLFCAEKRSFFCIKFVLKTPKCFGI